MTVYTKLINIQAELKAPKNQYNSFGKYNYRNAEDILEALKPLLKKHNATLFMTDEIVLIQDRYYVKSTANFVDIETGESIKTSAMAREDETKKGMDSSQITGATSSYSSKRALGNMFLIDDTKDSDFTNTHGKETQNNNTYQNSNQKITYTNNEDNLSYGDKTRNITLTDKQINFLNSLCSKKNTNKEKVVQAYNQKFSKNISLTNLTREDFDTIIELLKQ